MALVTTVATEKAEGIIKEGYEMFMKNVGAIPQPMQLLSVSPALFELQLKRIHYFSKHPKLSFALLAHIRYLAATTLDYGYCMDLNRHFLKKVGYDDDTIHAMEQDPSKSMLEEHESAMLDFVIRAMKQPSSITAENISRLKELGYEERDMVDALAQGVGMIDHAIMMQVFQIDQHCLLG
ncbi:MAG: hypothetical protein A2X81_03765 [Desulfobacterales bacterium GWB2_56_26]|nr:MAG: hypothetical protein A2X81_03765 [Desulfobacterales bacterium GWB2_56_26]